MNNVLFARVVELCKEKGISQRKLQEEIGMSTGALSKWKTSMPNATLLQQVADYFDVTTDYLTGRTEYRNKDHMLQSFDLKYKPDMTNTEIPFDYCVQTDEGIILIESNRTPPKYIDPATRQIAESITTDKKLKDMFEILQNLPPKQFNAIYNLLLAMNDF